MKTTYTAGYRVNGGDLTHTVLTTTNKRHALNTARALRAALQIQSNGESYVTQVDGDRQRDIYSYREHTQGPYYAATPQRPTDWQ